MQRTEIGQPCIFAMQVALAALWKSWGIQPAAIVGHSVGEIAATCVAGIFTLEEAARIIALRARLMEECGRGEGTMLAVGLPEDEAVALVARHARSVTISALTDRVPSRSPVHEFRSRRSPPSSRHRARLRDSCGSITRFIIR